MVRKLIGNRVGVSGIYDSDDNISLVQNLNNLNKYVCNNKGNPLLSAAASPAVNDLYISPDQTKLYIIDSTSDSISQFSLSNDYTSPSYNNLKQFPVTQEGSPTGVHIGAAGTAMYVIGFTNDTIYQYTLSTAYDVSTASYSGISFNITAREGTPVDLSFSDDGTKVYVLGQSAAGAGVTVTLDYVHQFNLSSPWSINTAGYSTSFYVGGQDAATGGLYIGAAGTAMYMVGTNNDTIYQYTLATPWEVNTSSYANKSFSVSSQEAVPNSIYFKPDGAKAYVLGQNSDAIFEYSLAIAWDISTASYSGYSFYVGAQESAPQALYFKPDGTSVYILGTGTLKVFQYPLTTAWDIRTVDAFPCLFTGFLESTPSSLYFKPDGTSVYILGTTGDRISEIPLNTAWDLRTSGISTISTCFVGSQDITSQGVYIGAAGTAMYMVGSNNDTIYQYTLSTAYDVSTASYSGISSNISARETLPTDLFFKDDGTKVYIVGQTAAGVGLTAAAEYIHQFNLSSPWNISTAGYSTSFYVTTQEPAPSGVYIGAAGTAMYVVGSTNDTIYQYTLGTPWEVNTSSYTNKSFSVNSQEATPNSIYFKSDGTKAYVLGQSNDAIFQYSLGTAWDITTASYENKSLYFGAQESTPTGLYFSPDGTSVYILGNGSDNVVRYPLSIAWDVSTWVASFYVGNQETTPSGLYFKPDGTKVYVVGNTMDSIYQYSLTTPWNLTTASYDSKSFSVSVFDTTVNGIDFSSDGTKVYIVGSINDRVHVVTLATPWDISTAINPFNIKQFPVTQEGSPTGVHIGAAGTAMYMVGSNNDTIYQYTLSTAYDVSTASYSGISSSVQARETNPQDLFFSDDGTKVYVVGTSAASGVGLTAAAEYIHQFNLSSPWSINTAGYSTSFYVTTQEPAPSGVYIGAAGTAMYVVGSTNDAIFQYTLGTPWQVNTASYTTKSFLVGGQESAPNSIYFKSDGTKVYILGPNTIFQYSLGTAWDITTASYDSKSLLVSGQEPTSTGLYFSLDGSKVFITGSSADNVYSYDLEIPWELPPYYKSLYVGTQDLAAQGIRLNNDLSKLYIVGQTTKLISYDFLP
jgi:DNA-binding beta-propeller fold protein YncE